MLAVTEDSREDVPSLIYVFQVFVFSDHTFQRVVLPDMKDVAVIGDIPKIIYFCFVVDQASARFVSFRTCGRW